MSILEKKRTKTKDDGKMNSKLNGVKDERFQKVSK